ncbi:MAG: hypothetical protein ACJAWV_000573, partial [Flammeovirgaceae bacterium]
MKNPYIRQVFVFAVSIWLLWSNRNLFLEGSIEYSDLRTSVRIENPHHKYFQVTSTLRIVNRTDEKYDSYIDIGNSLIMRPQENSFVFFPENLGKSGACRNCRTVIHVHSDLNITKDSSNQFLYWVNIDYVFSEGAIVYGEEEHKFYMDVRNGVQKMLKSPTIDTLHIPMISADTIIGDYKTIRKTYLFKQE